MSFWDKLKVNVAAYFGMVYIDFELVRLSMDQENYLQWLYNAMEAEDETKAELQMRIHDQHTITEYLRAGRTFTK